MRPSYSVSFLKKRLKKNSVQETLKKYAWFNCFSFYTLEYFIPNRFLGMNVLAPLGNQCLTDCGKALGNIWKKFPPLNTSAIAWRPEATNSQGKEGSMPSSPWSTAP